jgi:hypothetical protein
MKSIIKAVWCFVLVTGLSSAVHSASSEALKDAVQYGAKGKVTLRIIDDRGLAVSNAEVDAALFEKSSYAHIKKFEGVTDTNGCYVIEGKTIGELSYSIKKEGFYITRGDYCFYSSNRESVKDGRWLPWNPVVKAVLKPKKNPVPMYAKRVDIEIPEQNKSIGFDMEKGDWVSPYGEGETSDVYISYSLNRQDLWTGNEQFEISNTNLMCGVRQLSSDIFSGFKSAYAAPLSEYSPALRYGLNRTKTKIIEKKELSDSDYIIFRSRAFVDAEGNLERANYGKIYPPIRYGESRGRSRLLFTYYFNPTPNDRNLEFDTNRNLFPGEKINQP